MTDHAILTDATPAELTAAVGDNLYSLFREMAHVLPGSELFESDRLSRHLTFPHNPMFKGAWRTRLAREDVNDAIDETIAWFKERQAPFFFWWTDADTQPADLGDTLPQRVAFCRWRSSRRSWRGVLCKPRPARRAWLPT